jgi:hypothetical protein
MSTPTQVYLEADDEIRGQKFICLSFLSPERVLEKKEIHFFSKFLEFYAMEYKVTATESFLMGKLRDIQNVLSDVELAVQNSETTVVTDASGNATTPTFDKAALVKKISDSRESLAKTTAADLEAHVKANMSDFKTPALQEAYERYMTLHKTKLDDEFHAANHFQTSIRGLKCRGVYGSYEQATARAQQLHKKDPYFNVYVAEMGAWLPWDPEPEEVQDQQYSNDQLNKLMGAYRENATKRDAFFEEEKRQKMAAAAEAAKKKPVEAVFGESGKEVSAAAVAREVFEGTSGDLVIERKTAEAAEATAAAVVGTADTISLQ